MEHLLLAPRCVLQTGENEFFNKHCYVGYPHRNLKVNSFVLFAHLQCYSRQFFVFNLHFSQHRGMHVA